MKTTLKAFARDPNEWTLGRLATLMREGPFRDIGYGVDGRMFPARPEGYDDWFSRVRLAWAVFTGRADAVYWPEDLEPHLADGPYFKRARPTGTQATAKSRL